MEKDKTILSEVADPILSEIMRKIRENAPRCRTEVLRSGVSVKVMCQSTHGHKIKLKKLCLVLRTSGCSWVRKAGGCTMCGFVRESAFPNQVPTSLVVQQFSKFYHQRSLISEPFTLEIYTCGSFFDEDEISKKARTKILNLIAFDTNIVRLILESRPEHISAEAMKSAKKILKGKETTIAIGLETSNDFIRKKCLNKGFSFETFMRKARIVKRFFDLRVYLLVKPPFLTENEGLEDSLRSIHDTLPIADEIVLMPCSVQKYTLVHYLWTKGLYRPPWLWTIVEIYKRMKSEKNLRIGGLHLIPQPVDMTHNCGKCDEQVLDAISKYPQYGVQIFKNLSCACEDEWKAELSKVAIPIKERVDWFYKCLSSKDYCASDYDDS